jgi:hypothetical protein
MKRLAFSLLCLVLVSQPAWAQMKEVRLDQAVRVKPELMPIMLPGPGSASTLMPAVPGQKLLEDQTVGTTWYDQNGQELNFKVG